MRFTMQLIRQPPPVGLNRTPNFLEMKVNIDKLSKDLSWRLIVDESNVYENINLLIKDYQLNQLVV